MKTLFVLLLVVMAEVATAQTITFNGQFRERSEFDNRQQVEGAIPDVYHLLRTRFGATARIDSQITAVVEFQDARSFGQSRSTLNTGAPAFDLRQGYLDIRKIGNSPFSIRVGRQSIGYANERIMGRIDWSNLGQSFDGAVVHSEFGDIHVDLLGAAIARNPNASSYSRDVFLTGAWGAWKPTDINATLQCYYLFDTPRSDSLRQNRHTAGLHTSGTFASIDYEADGAVQFGDYVMSGETLRGTQRIAASLLGARIGYTVINAANLRIGIGYDRLSGHNPDKPDQYGAFNTLYATNHKYYGYMDYFTNIPLATHGMGLQDILVQASIAPWNAIKLAGDIHLFSLAVDPVASNPSLPSTVSQQIGQELDLTLTWKAVPALTLIGGYSVFDGNRDRIILQGRKTMQWGYVMGSVNF